MASHKKLLHRLIFRTGDAYFVRLAALAAWLIKRT